MDGKINNTPEMMKTTKRWGRLTIVKKKTIDYDDQDYDDQDYDDQDYDD